MNKDILQFAMDQSGLDEQQFNQQSTSSFATQPKKVTSSDIQPIVVNGQVYYKTPNGIVQIKPNNVIQLVPKFEFDLQIQAEQARRLLSMQNIFNNNQPVSIIHNQLNNIVFQNQLLNGAAQFARDRTNNSFTFNRNTDQFNVNFNEQFPVQNNLQNQPLLDLSQIVQDTISVSAKQGSKISNFNKIFKEIANDRNELDGEDNVQGETYADYMPSKLKIGIKHPDPVVETSSLSSVLPPNVEYELSLPEEIIDKGLLSALQLESITYACQQHERILPDGNRAGFLIGDGAGVGKGRTIAGIIFENYLNDRKKAIWLSISADLKYDSERDLSDIGASRVKVHALNKLKYGKLSSSENGKIKKGVIFSTYSSLISKSSNVRGKCGTRLGQLLDWCGEDFDGIIVFDECHKAKNLIPTAGKRGGESKPTKTAEAVVELQKSLPKARIVYASATGASEPKNMAYMVRLGLWGKGTSFSDFQAFMTTINKHGVGGMEMTAIDMKQRGLYMARQLSFKGVEFEIRDVNLTDENINTYNECADLWTDAKFKIEQALNFMVADAPTRKQIWNQFWSSHQRFFKYLCIAAKVPEIVRVTKEEIKNGNAVVIGLQSTGENRTLEALEDNNGELNDFVSTAKAVFTSFIEKNFPAPNVKKSLAILGLDKNVLDDSDYNDRKSRKARENTNSRLQKQLQEDIDFINDDSEDTISDSETDDSATDVDEDDNFELTDKSNSKKSDEDDDSTEEEEISDLEDSDDYVSEESDELESGDDDESDFDDSDVEPWEKYNNNGSKSNKRSKNKKTGKKKKRRLLSGSNDVNDKCVRFKTSLLEKIEQLSSKLPKNTIDELIDEFGGPDAVAELTGRKGRMVQTEGLVSYESRKELDIPLDQLNIAEKERFMNDEKHIAIISDAASSGISLQSDRRVKNKKRRVHITIELPWSADKAIQQFGRTHRSNQENAPKYIFMISKLAGEQRFAASVAKRLQSLGALLFGDRRANEKRDLSRFNFDPKYSKEALKTVMDVILGMESSPIDVSDYEDGDFYKDCREAMVGVGLIDFDKSMRSYYLDKEITVDRFLNRILGMKVNLQNALFKYFTDIMDVYIEHAKRVGKYDKGILEYRSDTGEIDCLDNNEYPFKHGNVMAKVELHKIAVNRGIDWENALEMLENSTDENEGFYETKADHYVRKCVWMVICDSSTHFRSIYRVYRPNIGQENSTNSISDLKAKGKKIGQDKAEALWRDIYDRSESSCFHKLYHNKCKIEKDGYLCEQGKRKKEVHILSGSILAIWSTIERVISTDNKLQIVRICSSTARFIGIEIPEKSVEKLKEVLNEMSKSSSSSITKDETKLNQPIKSDFDEDTYDSDIFMNV